MSVAIRTATRIQDMDDANVTPGAGVDEYALCWDDDAARFVLRAVVDSAAPFATIENNGIAVTNDGVRVWQQSIPGHIETYVDNNASAKIATHTSIHAAHGALVDADIPTGIMRDSEHASDPHTMTIDGVDVSAHAGNAAAHHSPVTLDTNADTLLSLSTQALGLDTQTANRVLGGPASGPAAVPTFRALTIADLPAASLFALLVVSSGAILVSNGEVTWQS